MRHHAIARMIDQELGAGMHLRVSEPEWNARDARFLSALAALETPDTAMIAKGWRAAHRVETEDRCNHQMLRQAFKATIRKAREDGE